MNVSGRATLGPGFVPENIQADVDGDVSARLLAYVAPDAVSDAQGTARIRATAARDAGQARGARPPRSRDHRLSPARSRAREVQVQSGIVEISNDGVIAAQRAGAPRRPGARWSSARRACAPGASQFTSLVPFKPGDFDLPLHGERLTYRSPGVFEVDDLAFDLDLRGNLDDGFGLGGEVRLVSGRYLQDFKVQNLVLSPRVNESSVRPFYEGKPLLEELALDLGVRTVGDGFVVQNNIAPEIHVDVLLHVGGTLSQPAAGRRRPPHRRALQHPVHARRLRPGAQRQPRHLHRHQVGRRRRHARLEIEAQNPVPTPTATTTTCTCASRPAARGADRSVQRRRPRSQPDRVPAADRPHVGRTSQRFGTQNPTVGANITTGADVAGQTTRDTVANLMEPYIDDTFQRADRPQPAPHRRARRVRGAHPQAHQPLRQPAGSTTLLGFQNQSQLERQRGRLWLLDYLSLGGGIEQIRSRRSRASPRRCPSTTISSCGWTTR